MPELNQEALLQAHVDIAVLKAEMQGMRREMDDMRVIMKDMAGKLDKVTETLTEAKGGWKLLMALGGAGAAFGAGFMWIVQHFAGRGSP